ncbi:hypothetical protein [Parasediminibacterium sp. JCM 36343]|uniref:hypothetical protein n=1 Tax=Parasediminibacterium sp. JCM 36343 TaxID=3374279 RepID=UPI003978BC1B
MEQIQIIPAHQIDTAKWDACVEANVNGLIYATAHYLNAMADNWSALVIDDYEAIMPLPWLKKWGFRYLYTPPLTQQLGLIGKASISAAQLEQTIQRFAKYGSHLFNYENLSFLNPLNGSLYNNYILDLNKPYQVIKEGYKKSFQKNINRAEKQGLKYQIDTDVYEASHLFYQYNKPNIGHVTEANMASFISLCQQLAKLNKVAIRKVTNNDNELLSIVLILQDGKRYYNILNYTSPLGRGLESNYFLYDNLFKELSNQPMLFDFEGSDLPGVKSFYESMGSINQPYFHWHFNKLPWFAKMVKG